MYVDDIIALSPKMENIDTLFKELSKTIDIKDMGPIRNFLGIEISRDRKRRAIGYHQRAYTNKILLKFGYKAKNKAKIKSPIPQGAKIEIFEGKATDKDIKDFQRQIGNLIYLMDKTRPDLAYPVGYLARYMANPSPQHFKLIKGVWEYLENVSELGLEHHSDPSSIYGYYDSDWGGDIGTRRSTTGYIFLFRGSPLSWNSKLQRTVALSSSEAEYMALKEAIKEQQYIKAILKEISALYSPIPIECLEIFTDSNSAIELAKNLIYHSRTKHVNIRYHYVRENVQNNTTKLSWIPTEGQLADALTKAISNDKWQRFIEDIGLKS